MNSSSAFVVALIAAEGGLALGRIVGVGSVVVWGLDGGWAGAV